MAKENRLLSVLFVPRGDYLSTPISEEPKKGDIIELETETGAEQSTTSKGKKRQIIEDKLFEWLKPVNKLNVLTICSLVTFLFIALPRGAAREIGPESNFCAEINRLLPGEELVLLPGDYRGPCTIRSGGQPDKPIVIRSQGSRHRARIVYAGRESNVLNVRADFVTIRGLEFGPTQASVDGIRIYSQAGITVEDCEFSRLGGIAVVANHTSVHGVTVRGNTITNSLTTAMYFGCHNGFNCRLTDLLVERNYIHGVDAPDPEIGYGIQVKLNSTAIIQDNVIVDTKGPGVMVYGSNDPKKASVVQRNFVAGSRKSSGIEIGGGPAFVTNNIAVGNVEGGITLEDYGRRGLLRGIAVLHNTLFANVQGGILAPAEKALEALILNNAAAALPGTRAFPPEQNALRLAGNRDCTGLVCFVAPEDRNFSPSVRSPLLAAGVRDQGAAIPADDYFNQARKTPATVGAIESPSGPIVLGIKPLR